VATAAELSREPGRHGNSKVHISICTLIGGVLWHVAIFGGFLFVPAGTLDWWRTWVFLGVVFGSAVASTVSVFRVNKDVLEERFLGRTCRPRQRGPVGRVPCQLDDLEPRADGSIACVVVVAHPRALLLGALRVPDIRCVLLRRNPFGASGGRGLAARCREEGCMKALVAQWSLMLQ
jgi:hypothetical protein